MTRLLILGLLFGVAQVAAQDTPRADLDGKIRVLDAIYGQDQRICSVYDEAARLCDGREYCEIRASNAVCGGRDPYRNVAKQLFIGYECGDGRRSITVDQERVARLYCRGGGSADGSERVDTVWRRGGDDDTPQSVPPPVNSPDPQPSFEPDQIEIQVVRYGAYQAYCDATQIFVRGCNGKSSCSINVDNDLCGDPYPGSRKRAYITYLCNGEELQRVVREDDRVALNCPSK